MGAALTGTRGRKEEGKGTGTSSLSEDQNLAIDFLYVARILSRHAL